MAEDTKFYEWRNFRAGYQVFNGDRATATTPALLLIHPIGVGLSGIFWQRFIKAWLTKHPDAAIYNPDLLGCGTSEMPSVAYYPVDWAEQLKYFLETVVKQPVVLVVQGASFPIAIKLVQNPPQPNWIEGLVLSGPPAWRTITQAGNPLQQKLLWNLLFNSPLGLGSLFYRYASRRQFIESFSERQLFANSEQVDRHWLDELTHEAKNARSRYAVFSFLAGFWREDYAVAISKIAQPTLVVFGKQASSISSEGKTETPRERMKQYVNYLPQGESCSISGRNVLPYESTSEFVSVVSQFFNKLKSVS